MRYSTIAVILMSLANLALTPAQKKQLDIKLTIEPRKEHPTVYMTRADIERAKVNRRSYPWAKAAAEKLIAEADAWANRSDEELIKLIPPAKACYAYGFSGCPVCGGTLAGWWGANGVASLEDPGHIKCVNGHRLPDEKHPDSGHGYTDPSGKKFYFVGTYHSFVIDTLTTATTKLVHAYVLTGEQKYAAKAALILDHLARIYPTSEAGSQDYPSDPPSGRFNRPWYQVARTLVFYANQYDILMMSDELSKPSCVEKIEHRTFNIEHPTSNENAGARPTRRENIEQNMLLNGAAYCYRQSVIHPALHNGQADYIRGPMAVGAAMGIRQYIEWGVDGPYGIRAMIANNVDRDGQYYETSAGYSDHARALYMDMAQIVRRWTDEKNPHGIDLTRDPTFVMFNLLPSTRLRCIGLPPSLGDDAPNVKRIVTTRPIERYDLNNLERLRALNDEADLARRLDQTLMAAAGGNLEAIRADFHHAEWLLFHAKDVNPEAKSQALRNPFTDGPLDASDLFAQKGLAILRSGKGEHARAATLRFGPTLNHGHLDEMNLNVYARGYEMTYDLGYSLGSTHTQVGWAKQTASHNVVVVDEKPQLASGRAGGTLKSFTSVPGVTIVRAENTNCYASQGVTKYERTVAMIDVNEELSYLVDIFHVVGGSKHDYNFHGMGTNLDVEGVELSAPEKGSLAGETIDTGGKIGGDGNVIGVVGKEYWNPPPGNGYGFLMHPRTAKAPDSVCSATWTIDRQAPARMRLSMLAQAGTQIVTCKTPGIYPKMPKASYVLARRSGMDLHSTFVSIIEPYGDQRAVRAIHRISTADDDAVALKVELADGRYHYVMWSQGDGERDWKDGENPVFFDGGFALERSDGSRVEAPATYNTLGTIERVDFDRAIIYTRARLAEGEALAGSFIYVGNERYAQESAYRIARVVYEGDLTAVHLAPTRLILGRGHMDAGPVDGKLLPNLVPLEYAKSVRGGASGFFRGKHVHAASGRGEARIEDVAADGLKIRVDNAAKFSAGDDLVIYDVWPGDTLRTAPWSVVARQSPE